MVKKGMPKYGIIDILRAILACNLANYQHFSIRPGLFDENHQIPYSLKISVQYHVKCEFYAQKNLQKSTEMPFSQ